MSDGIERLIAQLSPIPSFSADLVGWEPITFNVPADEEKAIRELLTDYLNMKRAKRPVAAVRNQSDGTFAIWERTDRADLWKA